MKTDLYTKTILTVIAIALTVIVFRNIGITNANAESRFVNVPLNTDGSMNVKVVSMPSILDVKVKEVDAFAFNYAPAIKVKIERD